MKLLLVDDNTSITDMLSQYLEMKGHDVAVVNSGRNALSMIQKNKYDTILLDLAMPEFTGLDIIDALEKNNQLKDQRVVIFTASSVSNETVNELLSMKGIIACLKKPVKLAELLETITSY